MTTPKILYQTWKNYDVPKEFLKNMARWKVLAPPEEGWQHILLSDSDLRKLVETNVPQHLAKYDSFTKNIERVDFARCVMMYLGGVYADLDTYPLRKIDTWLETNKIVFGREPIEHAREIYSREVVLCNAFMISPPKQQFWLDFMNYIMENYEYNFRPVDNTGPMAMTKFYESNPDQFGNIIITPPCTFFPLKGDGTVTAGCNMAEDTYVVHEWANTWVPKWFEDDMWKNKRLWFWAMLAIFIAGWLWCWKKESKK